MLYTAVNELNIFLGFLAEDFSKVTIAHKIVDFINVVY